jgi:hypothetical protein
MNKINELKNLRKGDSINVDGDARSENRYADENELINVEVIFYF